MVNLSGEFYVLIHSGGPGLCDYIIHNIENLITFFYFFSVPIPQSEAKESKPDVVEELMKKMFMRKVMAKFFGDANGMLSIYVFPVLLKRSCSGRF